MIDSVAPEELFARLARHRGPIIVDFDETLYLRNSTEVFLGAARPALLAAILLRLLDFCAPWRFTGGAETRDFWRVWLILWLLPGAERRWRQFCASQAKIFGNHALITALRASGQSVCIASAGFTRVIAPLAAALGCQDWPLIACSLQNPADRRAGKLTRVEAALGTPALASAMVMTDSLADAGLLAHCAEPCLTRWPGAKYERAFAGIYLPGDYLAYVKRPRVPGVLRLLVMDDLVWWVLIAGSAPTAGLAGAALLFLSFWSVYEAGYDENDRCAIKFETEPVVTPEFLAFESRRFERKTWISAGICGVAGAALLHSGDWAFSCLRWAALLLALRLFYHLYNHRQKSVRRLLYLPLQCFRSLGLAAVLPLGPAGLAAGLAQALARWLAYSAYRRAGGRADYRWRMPVRALQFLFLLTGLAILALAPGHRAWLGWPAWALLAWNFVTASREFLRLLRRRFFRPQPSAGIL